ncbi:hypothetical protein [Aliiroseovarius sp. F20344]|uniref:hypothetical protein n=1 Tax=Aliiroseovarius sp. F20344 TaxID=2926414 RepID=UPI001FF270D0|nr:hypothetical protein [Aliiroseovarius sp. F20344]MCK0143615.1 hypothetical protein [Aliiroseovarius sp. F20344]
MRNTAKLIALGLTCFASSATADVLPLSWAMPSGMPPGPIDGSKVMLERSAAGAAMILETSELKPGHAITVWFVAIQSPENCASNPCTPMEAMGMVDKMNSVATNAGGTVVAADGSIRVQGFLPVGEVAGNFYDTTFTAPETSEYHIVVHDHGPLIPELAADQISSFRGGCTAESVPPFYPDSSRTDGEGGPNSCITQQVALFVPAS